MNPELKKNGAIQNKGHARPPPALRVISALKVPPRPSIEPTPATEKKPQTSLDRFIDRSVDALSNPKAIYVQTAVTVGYMVVNTVAFLGFKKFDPYPFLFLNFVYSLASGYATVFVLNSNRRQEIAAMERNEAMHKTLQALVRKNERQLEMLALLTGEPKEKAEG